MSAPQFFQQDGAYIQSMKTAHDINFAELFGGTPPALIAASGAIPITPNTGPVGGSFVITKAGVAALTLAAPKAGAQNWQNIGGFLKNNGGQDGTILVITSSTLNAHTLTATGLLGTVGRPTSTRRPSRPLRGGGCRAACLQWPLADFKFDRDYVLLRRFAEMNACRSRPQSATSLTPPL